MKIVLQLEDVDPSTRVNIATTSQAASQRRFVCDSCRREFDQDSFNRIEHSIDLHGNTFTNAECLTCYRARTRSNWF